MHHVLVVGHEPDFLPALREAGFDVTSVFDLKSALNAVKKTKPELILVTEDRADIVHALADLNIRIVVLTSFSPLEVVESKILSHPSVRRCVFKPCRPRTFLEAIQDVLSVA